jgi:hypothetical protein
MSQVGRALKIIYPENFNMMGIFQTEEEGEN